MSDTILGCCKECGIAVTEKNVGVLEPKVLCARCCQEELDRQEREMQAAIEEEEQRERQEERLEEQKREKMRHKRNTSMIVGGIVAFAILLTMIIIGIRNGNFGAYLLQGTILGYFGFAFTASMFFDGIVKDIVVSIASKTIEFPGLIFTLDFDGIMWLISVKILFAIIGFFGGVFLVFLGVVVGCLVSGITYPFSLLHQSWCIETGNEEDFD